MSVVLLGSTSGSITLQEPAVAGTNTVNFGANTGVAILDANTPAFRNRIINGAMVIDQRNAGASISCTTSTFSCDRWLAYASQTSKMTAQQNAASVTPAVGFNNYLGITSSSAYSITATDIFGLLQRVEGFNFADLGWGTANAKPITLSFQVYSSLTGTFGGSLQNSASNRSYPFTYTISSANTWTSISITIAGDTSGTWIGATNGVGVQLTLGLGIGSTYSGTAGAWAGATYYGATGATSVVGTNGATFYITGVQLEKGSTATSFDYRSYGTELQLCQRYLPAWSGTSGNQDFCSAFNNTSTSTAYVLPHPVQTRVPPTGISATGTFLLFASNNAYTVTSLAFSRSSTGGTSLTGTITGGTAGAGGAGAGQGTWNLYLTGCEL
jgi:hypothetical protein